MAVVGAGKADLAFRASKGTFGDVAVVEPKRIIASVKESQKGPCKLVVTEATGVSAQIPNNLKGEMLTDKRTVKSEQLLMVTMAEPGSANSSGPHQKTELREDASVLNQQHPKPICPRCKSNRIWLNGHRTPLFGSEIQRYICRDCGRRFSDPVDVEAAKRALQADQSANLKTSNALVSSCQICDKAANIPEGAKNLATELRTVQTLKVPQKEIYDIKDQRGAIVEFYYYLERQERANTTKEPYRYNLEYLVEHGANLFDPASSNASSVKSILFNTLKDKSAARKFNLVKAYKAFMTAYGMDVKAAALPKYKPERKLPYLPPEAHLDQLIAACSDMMAAFLQLLKETAARPVEAMRILRDEIDFIQLKVPINHPAKGCNPRVITMSEKLCCMLKNLPSVSAKLFSYKNEAVAGKTFRTMRKNAVAKLGIKELRKISFYTFRYWRATVEFQETGKEVCVMILLGHTSTKYIFIYVQLAHIYFGEVKRYDSVWVHTREEETKASNEGYTYVRTDPRDGASMYRKPVAAAATLIGHD